MPVRLAGIVDKTADIYNVIDSLSVGTVNLFIAELEFIY